MNRYHWLAGINGTTLALAGMKLAKWEPGSSGLSLVTCIFMLVVIAPIFIYQVQKSAAINKE